MSFCVPILGHWAVHERKKVGYVARRGKCRAGAKAAIEIHRDGATFSLALNLTAISTTMIIRERWDAYARFSYVSTYH